MTFPFRTKAEEAEFDEKLRRRHPEQCPPENPEEEKTKQPDESEGDDR